MERLRCEPGEDPAHERHRFARLALGNHQGRRDAEHLLGERAEEMNPIPSVPLAPVAGEDGGVGPVGGKAILEVPHFDAPHHPAPLLDGVGLKADAIFEVGVRVGDIVEGLLESLRTAREQRLPEEQIIVDPGFNFGWKDEQALEMIRRLGELRVLGRPILIGTSRKSTIGNVLGGLPVEDRLEGTAATVAIAIANGADIVRVHDVREMARVARMADAVVRGAMPEAAAP